MASASRVFRGQTPRQAGWRWPAEWERHEATWLAWPHDSATWPGCLDEAKQVVAALAAAISVGESVFLLVKDGEEEEEARRALLQAEASSRVAIHHVPTADSWLRDTGPIVVVRGRGATRERLALDFRFNAWGGKYAGHLDDDSLPQRLQRIHGFANKRLDFVLEGGSIDGDGRGTILTTEQCLLHANRNPGLVRAEIEWHLREALGAKTILWLGAGIEGDDTDGHVDDISRFVAPGVVVTVCEEDTKDPNHAPLEENRRSLVAMEDARGRPLEVVVLPSPGHVLAGDGRRLPASYANFYIANKTVAVPVFGASNDAKALRTLRKLFPTRRVVPIRCERFVEGMGALHCITQQIPR